MKWVIILFSQLEKNLNMNLTGPDNLKQYRFNDSVPTKIVRPFVNSGT